MCGSGGDAGKKIADNQKAQEKRIQQGLGQLNAIFYGGSYGTNPTDKYDSTAHYYNAQGTPYDFSTSDPSYKQWLKKRQSSNIFSVSDLAHLGDNLMPETSGSRGKYNQFLAKSGDPFTGTESKEGFTPEFFDQAKDAYLAYALPQLSGQFGQARQGLDYRMANQGLLGSSAAHNLQNRLGNEAVLQKQNISNAAVGQSQQLQRDVNQQYQQLVGQL